MLFSLCCQLTRPFASCTLPSGTKEAAMNREPTVLAVVTEAVLFLAAVLVVVLL